MGGGTAGMKTRIPYIICLFVFTFLIRDAFSQRVLVSSSIDKNNILIGEPVRMSVEVILPTGTNVGWFPLDSIPHFEYVEKGRIDTVVKPNGTEYRQLLTLTSFDSGRWVLPPLALEVNGRYYLTDSLPVSVAFSGMDPNQEYHDIHDILEVKYTEGKYITWTIAAIAVLSLLAVIYFLRKRVAKVVKPIEKPEVRLQPFEEAMLLLEKLKNQHLPENGQVKLYYTGLNDILRKFIFGKTSMVTMQKTNEELILQLRENGLQNDVYIRLAQTLRMSDAVKFAKYVPERNDNEQSFDNIKRSIELLNNINK